MNYAPSHLRDLLPGAHPFDDIIDVRSPSEFGQDRIPTAHNLPVLDDDERARVGTIYTQQSPFLARKIGAALVARNAAQHIETALADRLGGWRPLIYCWRGGQRSNSFASILAQIGWRVGVLEGGYRQYRRLVLEVLDTPVPCPVVLLDGNTGTAKTDLLARLGAHGVQVIDLEGLAQHRGSVFGAMGEQPAQKDFESRLAQALVRLDPALPVVIEAESHRIGARQLPGQLWRAMCAAPRIEIDAPVPARARYLAQAYGDIIADRPRLLDTINRLRPMHPATQITAWHDQAQAGADVDLAESLVVHHYDPAYGRARARTDSPAPAVQLHSPTLDDAGLALLAQEVATAAIGLAAAAAKP